MTSTNFSLKAALLQDPELLKIAWACIRKSSKFESGDASDPRSWELLAAAARCCGAETYVEHELQSLTPERSSQARSAVQSVEDDELELLRVEALEHKGLDSNQVHAFKDLCAEISQSLVRMKDSQHGKFRNFFQHPVHEPTILKWPEVAEETWQRKLYEELTSEEGHKTSGRALADGFDQTENAIPAISDTGIPFDELRYTNWKTISSLLVQAEAWERRVEASADVAIKEQKALPQQKGTAGTSCAAATRYFLAMQQFEAYQQDIQTEQVKRMSEEDWRNRILKLRDPDYDSYVHINTASLT